MGSVFFTVVIYPLTQLLEVAFSFSNQLLKNTGFALFGVSLGVTLLTLPLYAVADRWQSVERELQARMRPQVARIKRAFKGDERFMILSVYYRQNHYHPIMALRSAFGILVQIPFFTAAYTFLSHNSALQNHHLFFIKDLGRPDSLFTVAGFAVNVLPIAMTAINCVSSAIYTKGFPLREKLQVYGLAAVFLLILYGSPAGLVVYWTMNNVFSLIKNIFYKFKNPTKAFYLTCAAAAVAFLLFTHLSHRFNTNKKVAFTLFCAIILLLPLFIAACKRLISRCLFPLHDNSPERTALFLSCAAALAVLVGAAIPSLLISSSVAEFCGNRGYENPAWFVKNAFLQVAGLCFLWPVLVYFLFDKGVQTIIATLFFFALSSSLVNYFFFTGGYGYLSPLLIFTEVPNIVSPVPQILINFALVVFVFALCVLLIRLHLARVFSSLAVLCAVSLAFLAVVQVGKIKRGYKDYVRLTSAGNVSDQIEPIFHLSKTGKNVIMIFLDRAQNRFVKPMLDEAPQMKEQFSGFTLYENVVSYNQHTLIGAPPVHGGYEYTPTEINKRSDKTLREKHNEALLVLPRIFTEQVTGYSATSSDASWANYSWIPDISIFDDYPEIEAHVTQGAYLSKWYEDNEESGHFSVASDTLKRNVAWYAVFRVAPLFLRPLIYYDGGYWSSDAENKDANNYLEDYAVMHYLKELTDFDCPAENSFLSFTNDATHTSFFLQAPDYTPVAEVTNKGSGEFSGNESYHSMAGIMHRLGEWLEWLQENGVYDNCRILIVSDHGCDSREAGFNWDERFEHIKPGKFHPLFMFKDFGERGSLKTNTDFMSNADAPYFLTQGIVENPHNPFTGKPLTSSATEEGALITSANIFLPHHSDSEYVFTIDNDEWFLVRDNIFESANWTEYSQNPTEGN